MPKDKPPHPVPIDNLNLGDLNITLNCIIAKDDTLPPGAYLVAGFIQTDSSRLMELSGGDDIRAVLQFKPGQKVISIRLPQLAYELSGVDGYEPTNAGMPSYHECMEALEEVERRKEQKKKPK